jgi:hypothetical protein
MGNEIHINTMKGNLMRHCGDYFKEISGDTEEIRRNKTERAVSGFEAGIITITSGVSCPKDDDALKVIQLENCLLLITLKLRI